MTRKNALPKFPESYIGEKADQYDRLKWMERNQKKSTERAVNYLYDEKLGAEKPKTDYPYLILDLGCGSGFSSEVMLDNNFRVLGIDILIDMLSIANDKKRINKYDLDFILADINYLPLKEEIIDHIISISAYNFITYGRDSLRDKRKAVTNTAKYLRKILKDNGRIIIEFYPENDYELELFMKSFSLNGFEGFMVKDNPNQKSGQTFLLLKRK